MLEDVERTTAARALLALWFSLAALPRPAAGEPTPAEPGEPASRWMTIEGVDIHYRLTAEPREEGDPLLLLVHGWLGSSYDFAALMAALPRNLSAVAPDLPGHGLSQKSGIVFSTDYYVEFLAHFLRALGIERVILVGHSMGGGLAVNFAYRHPERVERLVLIDPDGLRGEEGFLGLIRRLGPLVELGVRLNNRLAIRIATKLTVFHNRNLVTEEYLDAVAETCLTPAGRIAQREITTEVLGSAPVDELLPLLAHPTLVVWGEEDRVLRPKWASEFLRRLPNARLVTIPGSGHVPQMEAPATVARLLAEFAGEAASPGR